MENVKRDGVALVCVDLHHVEFLFVGDELAELVGSQRGKGRGNVRFELPPEKGKNSHSQSTGSPHGDVHRKHVAGILFCWTQRSRYIIIKATQI